LVHIFSLKLIIPKIVSNLESQVNKLHNNMWITTLYLPLQILKLSSRPSLDDSKTAICVYTLPKMIDFLTKLCYT